MILRRIALALGLVTTLFFVAGCGNGPGSSSAAAKKVASIDTEAMYQLDMFKQAEESLKKWSEEQEKTIKEQLPKKDDNGKRELMMQYQRELEVKTNETMTPLKNKVSAAIATAAKDGGYTVVLDKKIVVFGVPELTDDVKKLLESGKELTLPESDAVKESPIGYFDQNVIRNLKVFKEAEFEILQERDKLIQEIEKKLGKNPQPAEIEAAKKQMEVHLGSLQQSKMGPLFKAVTDSVADVAKEENLSLVLNTEHVMHGGRNLTEAVVDSFLKKVGSGMGAPSATATPDGGK